MVPKKDLFSICKPNDLPLLKFFVFQCLFKRKGFIIPKLEYEPCVILPRHTIFKIILNVYLICTGNGFQESVSN